jgi:hypothetical protein
VNKDAQRKWTELGYRYQQRKVLALKKVFDQKRWLVEEHGTTAPSSHEQLSDHSVHRSDRDIAHTRWSLAETDFSSIRPLPAPRSSVQSGTSVRIKWLDHPDSIKEGTEESFIFGGKGEAWEEGDIRVISCDSPLGKALVGATKGEERQVRYPKFSGEVEVIAIAVPDFNALYTYIDECMQESRTRAEAPR